MTTTLSTHAARKAEIVGETRGLVRKLATSLLPVLLIGCAAAPISPNAIAADDTPEIFQGDQVHEDRGQLMYELMIAELAGRRGYLDVAVEGYLRASQRTDDVRVAERAAKLAVWGQLWESAATATERWIEIEPEAKEAHELLAQVLMRSEEPKKAADEFIEVVRSSTTPDVALKELYVILSGEPDREAALQVLQSLEDAFPEHVEAHLGAARLKSQLGMSEAALESANQALEIDASNADAVLVKAQSLSAMGQSKEGLQALADMLKDSPDNIALRMGYARLLLNSGDNDAANREFEVLFEQAPTNANLLLSIGLLSLETNNIEAAERYLEALLKTQEHNDQAHFYLARIKDSQSDFAGAIEHYDAVPEGDLYLSAQLRTAELFALDKQLDKGIERLHQLSDNLVDDTMQPMLITTEGRMLQNAGKVDQAVTILSAGLEKFPDNGDLLYARALAADRAGDSETLKRDLGKLVVAEPENANALNALGYYLVDENTRLDEAQQYLEKALSLRPNDAAILDSVGWLHYRQGNNEESLTYLQKAYELLPDGEIAAHLGEVLWALEKKEEAKTLLNEALEISPEDPKILKAIEKFAQ